MRLVCFPHAGAGASVFHGWAAPLAEAGIEVRAAQYPGRESRWGEPLISSVQDMAEHWVANWPQLRGADDVPVAIYGHSMGALVAYELARALQNQGILDGPKLLLLGGRNAPHVPSKHPPIHHLPDNQFLCKVAERYGNLPQALLDDEEMRALVVPILKADFQLVDDFDVNLPSRPELQIPITVFEGSSDPFTNERSLKEWSAYTDSRFEMRRLDGDHFFHQHRREVMLKIVRDDLVSGVDRPVR
ncbi:alpha/beta fold hydrolase [Opitutaceae bacterium]|nr:alpha/beta fold hydrolase [Opitutaceae bacterium]